MRTAFAVAAIAASANALDAMAIPDFIAGFIFGLTGDNHLAEIEQCYQGGQSVVTDGQAVIADLKGGHLIQGVKDAKTLADAISPALSNCQNMDGDIAEIEAWAKGFEDIGHLTKEVTKNWLLHKKKVKADIAQEEADWASKDYFGAGKETAYALDLLVPFSSSANGLPVKGGIEFLGGFLDGFIGDSHLTEIAACEVDAEAEGQAVEQAFADFEAGHKIKAITEFKKIVSNWQTALTDCQPADMTDDIQALEAWGAQFKDPKALISHVTKRFLLHRKEIETDFSTMKTDWASAQYTAAGEAMADLVVAAIGPVNKSEEEVELDVMAVPDFIAGFLYELTGDNDLEEIEACYQGGDQVVADAQTALADIKAGNFIHGVEDLGKVVQEVPTALSTCEGMQDDIAALESYAKQFTNVGQITKEVAKNWLLHGKKIKADIADEQADWAEKNYFGAGKETAAALELLVPFKAAEDVDFDPLAVPDFIAGFMFEITGDNNLTEIEQCYQGGDLVVSDAQAALADIKAGHFINGVEDLGKVVYDLPDALADCTGMQDDITTLETYAAQFKNVGQITKEVAKNWLLHGKKIKADIAQEQSEWASGDYFNAGKETAAALELLVPFTSAEEDNLQLDILGVPEFAAGFLYGMVGDNHLEEFQTCMTSSDQLVPYVEAFLSDLESFKIISAFENFEKFLFHFQADVAPCKNVSDDVAAIEQWAQIFKEPTNLVETLGKHWLLHQRQIKKDIAAEKADWSAKNYFKAGADIADAVTLAVGPVEKDIAVEMFLQIM